MNQSNSLSSSPEATGVLQYRLSSSGRKTALVLLAGVASIFGFAVWTLLSLLTAGIELGEMIPLVLMVGILIASPLLAWNIVEELFASIELSEEALVFRSAGIEIPCPWSDVTGFSEPDGGTWRGGQDALVHLSRDCSSSISSPLLRFLHRQAHGSRKIRLYSSLDDREKLQGRIKESLNPRTEPAS